MQNFRLYTTLLIFAFLVQTMKGQDSASVWIQYQKVKEVQEPFTAINQMQTVLTDAENLQLDELSVFIKKDLARLYLGNRMNNEVIPL